VLATTWLKWERSSASVRLVCLPVVFHHRLQIRFSDVTDATQRGTFQLRVWDNKGGTIATWDQALTAFRAGQTSIGYSPLFTVPFSLGGFGALPNQTLAPNLTGLQSFQLYNNVPEPSTIALGILGAGCLFLLRRRK